MSTEKDAATLEQEILKLERYMDDNKGFLSGVQLVDIHKKLSHLRKLWRETQRRIRD